jgi:cupin superfamily protein
MTGATSLSRIVAPLTAEAFLSRYAKRSAVHLRGESARFEDLVPLGGLPAIVKRGAAENVDVVRSGIGQPLEGGDVDTVLEEAGAGSCALRIRRAQSIDDGLRALAVGLATELDEEVNVNLYWSQGDAAGLAPHRDPYDVLVVQVLGSKRWTLLGGDGFDDLPLATRDDVVCGTRGELDLAAGGVLYLPAGLRHQARMASPEPSFHLTVGIHAKSQRAVIEWLMAEADGAVERGAMDSEVEIDATIASVGDAVLALAGASDRLTRFRAHCRALQYERTIATPREHERLAWRRSRS